MNHPGRFGFVAAEGPEDVKQIRLGKRVPDEYRRPGAANPITHTWKR